VRSYICRKRRLVGWEVAPGRHIRCHVPTCKPFSCEHRRQYRPPALQCSLPFIGIGLNVKDRRTGHASKSTARGDLALSSAGIFWRGTARDTSVASHCPERAGYREKLAGKGLNIHKTGRARHQCQPPPQLALISRKQTGSAGRGKRWRLWSQTAQVATFMDTKLREWLDGISSLGSVSEHDLLRHLVALAARLVILSDGGRPGCYNPCRSRPEAQRHTHLFQVCRTDEAKKHVKSSICLVNW
jgi:hypothetical protein